MIRRPLLATAAAVLLAVGLAPVDTTAAAGAGRAQAAPSIELVEQTAVVPPGGAFVVRLRTTDVPADGSLRIVLHQRVRSRSELAQSMEGNGLRSEVFSTVTPLDALPDDGNGTRQLTVGVAPAAGGVPLGSEGVYPMELEARDAAGSTLATLVTHLVRGPADDDQAPSLGVAVVAELGAPPAFQPHGSAAIDLEAVADVAATAEGVAAAADVPATLRVTPETVDALTVSASPDDASALTTLAAAATGHAVLGTTYVDVDPDALAATNLLGEFRPQVDAGARVLTDALGVTPVGGLAMAPSDLGADGMRALAFAGVSRVVVADTQIEPLDPGTISYSLAQPVVVRPPEPTSPDDPAAAIELQGLVTDQVVLERLDTPGSAGLVASRVLTELAFIRLEQPSVPRSAVLPLPTGTPADVARLILQGLGGGRPFAPMALADAFTHAAPLLDAADNQVDLRLLPTPAPEVPPERTAALTAARADLRTYEEMLGDDTEAALPLERNLLLASAVDLDADQRAAHVEATDQAVADVIEAVSTPATFTLTLAARDGTIPLVIDNDSGEDLQVTVRLRSQKLEFPSGDTIPVLLTEPTQRVDIDVRALASGAFPLQIEVTSPDGRISLASSRYTIRSTAVSGAGLVLSVGAGLFLVVWWARHWHRTRRSAKLVSAHVHPSSGPSEQ